PSPGPDGVRCPGGGPSRTRREGGGGGRPAAGRTGGGTGGQEHGDRSHAQRRGADGRGENRRRGRSSSRVPSGTPPVRGRDSAHRAGAGARGALLRIGPA